MAWMAMLGADSVDYHRENVIARGDDHAGQALAYYASRGETPLVWGGAGAAEVGLAGAVADGEYTAVFGPGGARHPATGERLVTTRRPGIDLVVSAHKSVAELGVIGRAEDMHAILDAEREATLAYLDQMVQAMGGRRGRARTPTPTGGLVYAHTRHATSRAGDPCPHDHVLVANVVAMRDGKGGWKALDTVGVRDHLHAATMVGRLAAARRALELGYAIEPDDGASGRLGHWRIAGIPGEVEAVHSKRSEEIHAHLARRGFGGWRARQVAARKTREVKRHTAVTDLLPVWHAELEAVGWSPDAVMAAVAAAGEARAVPGALTDAELQGIVAQVVDPDGRLARAKVFHRRDVVVAAVPLLFGRPAESWRQVVDAVLASPDVVPLLPVAGSRGRAWALASVLAAEQAIADTVARGAATRNAAVVPSPAVDEAIAATEARLGRPLTPGQAAAVRGICGSGERVSLVLGVAGAGKTTALRCVAGAYRAAGYEVLGTATSGQAARTLGAEARVASRTVASLCWRLDHDQLTLTSRTVVILDEAGMTDDPDLFRLLAACDAAGTKVVLVGDDRQLSAVGPGGALGALLDRHSARAHVLDENIRQADPGERAALAELRTGDVGRAVSWYAGHGCIHTSPDRDEVLSQMVDAWAADALAGRDAALYAWQRRNVEDLNRVARARWAAEGRLSGPELEAPGGRRYQAGDEVITLSHGRDTVTSQRGTVLAARADHRQLVVRLDDGRVVTLAGAELDRQRLGYGYAVTVHRAQGATVDIAHRFEDGGGRELAYVALSRARTRSHSWVVADDLDQAREDLVREWSAEARARWAIDTTRPDPRPARPQPTPPPEAAPRTERARTQPGLVPTPLEVLDALPADPTPAIRAREQRLRQLDRDEHDLITGGGRWATTDIGAGVRELRSLHYRRRAIEASLQHPRTGRRDRRRLNRDLDDITARQQATAARLDRLAAPELSDIHVARARVEADLADLAATRDRRDELLRQHPDLARSLGLESAVGRPDASAACRRQWEPPRRDGPDAEPWRRPEPRAAAPDLGLEL